MALFPKFIGLRKVWKHEGLLNMDWRVAGPEPHATETAMASEATLVGSETIFGTHMPVLDIDFDAHLEPSSTPGHFHLYLNKQMTWERYRVLLLGLYESGVIQEGFYRMALQRGQTFVRFPGVKKKPGETGSGDPEFIEDDTDTPDPF